MSKKKFFPEVVWEDEDQDQAATSSRETSTEAFSQLLSENKSWTEASALEPGAQVSGTVMSISAETDQILIDLGQGHAGVLAYDEFEEVSLPSVGDQLTVFIISMRDDEILVSRNQSSAIQATADLERAFNESLPVKGKVLAQNKGGLTIGILGKRAFCPWSQVALEHVADGAEFMNKEYDFLIEKYSGGGRDIVVSRAKLLKAQKAALAEQRLSELKEGQELTGTVSQLRDFGAFVDLGGVEGMVHVSEISHVRISSPGEVLTAGETVQVKVLKIERDVNGRLRIALSMKQVQADPFDDFVDRVAIGHQLTGEVSRITDFGAFVQLSPGVDGLLHVSEMREKKRLHHPREFTHIGAKLEVFLKTIDRHNRRLGLGLEPVSPSAVSEASSEKAEQPQQVDMNYIEHRKQASGTLGALLAAKEREKRKGKA